MNHAETRSRRASARRLASPTLHHTLAKGVPVNTPTVRYIVLLIGISFITISYWLVADPPNLWILAIAGAGILVGVGITIAKTRAGHFDKD